MIELIGGSVIFLSIFAVFVLIAKYINFIKCPKRKQKSELEWQLQDARENQDHRMEWMISKQLEQLQSETK